MLANLVLASLILGTGANQPAKVRAEAPWPYPTGPGKEFVLRTPAELLAATPNKAKDPLLLEGAEQRTLAEVAKALKVKEIDWKTQMLVVIRLEKVHPLGIEMNGVGVRDGELTVRYHYWRPVAGRPQDPSPVPTDKSVMVLVDRFDGKVRFAGVERTLK